MQIDHHFPQENWPVSSEVGEGQCLVLEYKDSTWNATALTSPSWVSPAPTPDALPQVLRSLSSCRFLLSHREPTQHCLGILRAAFALLFLCATPKANAQNITSCL